MPALSFEDESVCEAGGGFQTHPYECGIGDGGVAQANWCYSAGDTMKCPHCERENHPDAHSCEWCGTPLGGGRVIHRPDPSTADLSSRVIAKVIDLPFTAASLIAASLIPAAVPSSETIQLGLILVGAFGMLVQVVLLSSHGQTIGKRLMGLRIVRADTGRNGGFVTNVLLRAGVNGLLGLTIVYFVVDSLFLLFRNRLCLHDYIAGTKVVKVVQ